MFTYFLPFTSGLFYFFVAAQGSAQFPLIPANASSRQESSPGVWPWQVYETESFNPPVFDIQVDKHSLSPGYVFISPNGFNFESDIAPSKQNGPLIMDDKGEWARVAIERRAFNIIAFW